MTDTDVELFELWVYHDQTVESWTDIVSFEPRENVYLAVTAAGERIVIPYGRVLRIVVEPQLDDDDDL